MGMTWSEYKKKKKKKKKEEQSKKEEDENKAINNKQTSIPSTYKRTIQPSATQTISNNNKLANNIMTNITGQKTNLQSVNLTKKEELKNQKLERIYDDGSTWGNIVKFFRNAGRAIDNLKEGAKNGIIGAGQSTIRDVSDVENFSSNVSRKITNKIFSSLGDKGKVTNMFVDASVKSMQNKRNEDRRQDLEDLQDIKNANTKNIQKNIFDANMNKDPIGTKLTELAPSMGQQLPGYAMNAVLPGSSLLYFKLSSEANYYDDAKERGMTEGQSKVYSKLMSWVEAGTEQLSVENIQKGGQTIKALSSGTKNAGLKNGLKAGIDVFKETAKEETANSLKEGLKNYGIGIAEEAFQEAITEPIQEFTAMKVAGEDKADWNNMWQRMLQSGFDGALSSAIIAGANMGVSSCQGIVTKIENGQEISNQEYNKAVKDASKKVNIEKLATDGIKNEVNKLKSEMLQNQVTDNKVINQEQKTSQNGFLEAEKTETLRQEARNKLESIKQNYDENSYNQMQEFIETAPSEKALNQVISDLNKEAETKQVAPIKQKQEVQLPMKQETQNKSFEDVAFEAMSNYESNEVESPLKNRDMESIGKQTNVNAYQYDNPKVKPYFQEMAQQMGEDLAYISSSDNRSTQKGGGTKLSATTKAMDILHNEQGYSYDQIAKGLQNIIDDKGSENNAISKKIELVIDEQLRNGYTNALGKNIEPNQEYINTITEQYSLAEQPQQNNFKYEQSNNAKVDTFRQDASKYWDNSEKTAKLVNTIEKVINDKGYNIRLNDTIGDNVNGKIVTNQETGEIEITINPNSSRAGEFILGHELTHAIQTQEMVDLVNNRMQKDGDLRNAVEDLKKLYNTDEVNAEVLADISGQLFGNQEFINNLSVEKPNVFKRIYDKIVSLANKITGNSSEALFIKDLRNKWEQAYRENNNTINEEQYSIETENNQEKLENNVKKVYNIINKSITNSERNQVSSEVLTWRNNQDDGVGYIDLSAKGYKSYIYNKQGNNVETLLKVNGNEDFKNYIRKGIEDGTFENTEGLIKPIDAIKNEYRRYSNNNDLLSRRRTDNSNDKLSIGLNGEQRTDNSTENIKQSSRNESIENSEKSSFNLSGNKRFDVTGNENLDKSGTLFFRTREDGIYYVQATDHSGDLIYEGTFLNKKSLSRTLGEDIANYIVENSEKTNNEIYIENNGNTKSETDYMMRHRPSEEYGNGSNFEKNMDGVFEHPQWYMNMNEDWNVESLNALRRIRNKPDAEITIYRATPGNKINPGDWVTPSKKYAELHNNSQLDGKGNILELKVKAKDILWGGDDINEFGYYPNNEKYSKQNNNWQDYLESNYKSEGTTTDLRDIRLPMKEKQEVKAPIKQQDTTQVKFSNDVIKTNSEIKGNSDTSEKVAKILSEPVKKAKPEQRTWAILKANFIDKGAVFEKIAQKTNNRDLQSKYDYTLTSGARGQYAIGNDRYVYSNGKKTLQAKALTSIIDEVGENSQAFNEYMYHQLNVDRMTLDKRFGIENKPVFAESVTADMSKAEIAKLEEQHPEFKKYAKDVYNYLDANKQELVDRGVISQETSDMFKERYPHYVPIERVNRNGTSIDVPLDTKRTGINTPIKKAKGGNQDISPLFQTMANKTLQTYRASARNNFGLELMNTLNKINQLSEKTDIADIDSIMDSMTDEEQNNELLQKGNKGENPTFTVFDNGKKVTYEISQDMYDALKPKNELLSKLDNTKMSAIAKKISNFRRGVLTEYNPVFSITNALKDAQDVLINSQHSAKTYSKFPEAYSQILKKGYWYNEYLQNGGEQNSYFTEGDFENLKETKADKVKNILTFPLQKISDVNNVIEMAPRLAEYIVSRENGASIETAMLDASRVTTNFKAGGDITKFANRNGATFLNASVQGFQQQVRNIQEANMKGLKGWTNLALKYTVAGLPALLLNNLFWDDDDDYEQLQDYVKDNYYVVAKLPNGNFLRIPKGRMVATIQKVVSNANDFVKDGKINSDDVASTIWNDLKEDVSFGMDNLAPNNPIDNNILSPIIQVAQNKTWYGDDLVPQRLQDVPEEEQADETTDKFSKWLGEKLKVSPIKINYLLDQYSGGIGDVLLPLGTPQAENNVIEDKFTTDPVMKSQYPADFFNKRDELNVRNNSLKATDEDKLKYKYISSIQSNISDLYKQKREIQASDKTDKEKKAELKKVQKQINELARESLETVDKVEINGNGAKIGEQEYYKKNGTWTKLTEKEKEKLRNTSMSTYSSYQSQISGKDLKDYEKIQILRDSNYSNEEKSNLYEKTISTDKYYSTLKKSGIDIDEYMDYKLAQSNGDFTADKKNGKTVMGSGKKKVLNYLNKNITGYGNRLLIAGKQYSLTASQRKDLSNYINKTFATQAERTEVYKQLKLNFVVNGNKVTYK